MTRVYQYQTAQNYVVDPHSLRRNAGRMIDWDQVPDSYRNTYKAYTVKLSAASDVDDTELDVDALPVTIPAGTNLYFGEEKELVHTTVIALKGATKITVEKVPTALEDNDEATFAVAGGGAKVIKAGTAMCVIAASGKIVPRAARPGSETAAMLLETDAASDDLSVSGYGCLIGGVLYENLLPDHADGEPWDTYKTELATALCRFNWEDWNDSRDD